MSKGSRTKHGRLVIQDEADASIRESARQTQFEVDREAAKAAMAENDRVIRAAAEATYQAERQPTAEAAKLTFWARLRTALGL